MVQGPVDFFLQIPGVPMPDIGGDNICLYGHKNQLFMDDVDIHSVEFRHMDFPLF